MDLLVNEKTIKKLKNQYCKAKQYLNKYFAGKTSRKELFDKNFHIRPTSNYFRITCITDNTRFAMRTLQVNNEREFYEGIDKSFLFLADMEKIQSLLQEQIERVYGFKPYEVGKRKEQTEYVIQAKFCQYLKKEGYNLLTTEFNIKSGGRQRVDIVARKGKELWIFEIKDGDVATDSTEQVLAYKKLLEANKHYCFELLSNFDEELKEDFVIKTGVVYTKGQKSKDNIDALFRYDKETNSFSE
ncbi:MAG: hypothetical protein E7346_04330 [Clostridiales bacterium]|nr:hypothetical protein [Clostridiales bacterium]